MFANLFTPLKASLTLWMLICFCNICNADISVGHDAPNIEGILIDGTKFSLQQTKGKVILVNFWASWCEPCREEMPAIQSFLDLHKSEGFDVLAINMDKPKDAQDAQKIMRNYSFLFANKEKMDFSSYGRIWRIPSSFIIDKKGILRKNGLTGDPKVDQKLLNELVLPLLTQ